MIKHRDTIHTKKATAEMKKAKDINDSQTLEVNKDEWLISIDKLQIKRKELYSIYKSLFKFDPTDEDPINVIAINNLKKFFADDVSQIS